MKVKKRGRTLKASPILKSEQIKQYFLSELENAEKDLDALSEEQVRETLDFWNKYTKLDSAGWAAYYTKRTGRFDARYVPYDLFYGEIDLVLNNAARAYGIDDKLLYYRLLPKELLPEMIISKIGSVYRDSENRIISADNAYRLCEDEAEVVYKPSFGTCGGNGVTVFSLPRDKDFFQRILSKSVGVIVQKKIIQHSDLAVFHPASVNTVRMLTYMRENGEVVVLSAALRMGVGKMKVDNNCSGGCSCGICKDGTLRSIGYSNEGNQIEKHPDGVAFKNLRIPCYEKMVSTAKEVHNLFPMFAVLAYDFSVNEQGELVLIEINIGKPSIDFMQLNNGPLFGRYTLEILERVYKEPFIC